MPHQPSAEEACSPRLRITNCDHPQIPTPPSPNQEEALALPEAFPHHGSPGSGPTHATPRVGTFKTSSAAGGVRLIRTPKTTRKAVYQRITHEYVVNPPPQTGFLTLPYEDRERFGRALGGSWAFGARDNWRIPLLSQGGNGRDGTRPDIRANTNATAPVLASKTTSAGKRMAPVLDPGLAKVRDALKDVIQNLYDIQSQVHGYVEETHPVLIDKMIDLTNSLSTLQTTTQSSSNVLPDIPPELIDYVDEGRNPDIYTREFVELVQRGNAVVLGRRQAFAGFSQLLARKLVEMDGRRRREADRLSSREENDDNLAGFVPKEIREEVGRIMQEAGIEWRDESLEEKGGGGQTSDEKKVG